MRNLTRHHAWLAIGLIFVVWHAIQLIVSIVALQASGIFWGIIGLAIGLLISYQSLEYFGGWRYQLSRLKPKRKKRNVKNQMRGTTGSVVDINSKRKLH